MERRWNWLRIVSRFGLCYYGCWTLWFLLQRVSLTVCQTAWYYDMLRTAFWNKSNSRSTLLILRTLTGTDDSSKWLSYALRWQPAILVQSVVKPMQANVGSKLHQVLYVQLNGQERTFQWKAHRLPPSLYQHRRPYVKSETVARRITYRNFVRPQ